MSRQTHFRGGAEVRYEKISDCISPIRASECRKRAYAGEGVDVTEIPSDEDIIISKDSSTRNRWVGLPGRVLCGM